MNPPLQRARLRIVSINDVYSLAYLPRLQTLVKRERTEDPADVFCVTVAGDFLAPSLLSSLDGGRGMVDCLEALGVTHVTLGNHEDDLPLSDLVACLGALSAKVLLTNGPSALGAKPQRFDILSVGGWSVGFVGAPDLDPALFRRVPFGGAQFGPANESIATTSALLREKGCVAVVALTHQRLADDRALAERHVVDLILGGHEHEGYLERGEAHPTPLAKAPMNAMGAVIADLLLGPEGVRITVRLESVVPLPEDPEMRARVERHLDVVRALEGRVLLRLAPDETLSSVGSRRGPTSVGTLVCSRLRDAFGAEVAVFNGGGIRGETEHRGAFTYADLRDELPFENEACVAVLPGSVLRDAIRYARTELVASGGFLHVDDAAEVSPSHALVRVAHAPLDPDRLYRVAIVRDLLLGMDRIAPLTDYVRAHPEIVPAQATGLETKVALLRAFVAQDATGAVR